MEAAAAYSTALNRYYACGIERAAQDAASKAMEVRQLTDALSQQAGEIARLRALVQHLGGDPDGAPIPNGEPNPQ